MIITLTGHPGSGKTTVADFLAKRLNLKRYSGGDFMRELAIRKGVSLLELSRKAEKSFEVDKEIDKMYRKLQKEDNFFIDSRLGFIFLPNSIKIFLSVNPKIGAKRIFKQKRRIERENTTLTKTLENIRRREKSERLRYKKYYGINIDDLSNYDIIIDTSNMNTDEANNSVLKAIKKFNQ